MIKRNKQAMQAGIPAARVGYNSIIHHKKSQGLSINVIIVAAIALIVLVILIAIFTGRMQIWNVNFSPENNDCYVHPENFASIKNCNCIVFQHNDTWQQQVHNLDVIGSALLYNNLTDFKSCNSCNRTVDAYSDLYNFIYDNAEQHTTCIKAQMEQGEQK